MSMMTSSNETIFRVTGHLCEGHAVTRSFDVFVDLRLNKGLSKQWWGKWFETPSPPLPRDRNEAEISQTGKLATEVLFPLD